MRLAKVVPKLAAHSGPPRGVEYTVVMPVKARAWQWKVQVFANVEMLMHGS